MQLDFVAADARKADAAGQRIHTAAVVVAYTSAEHSPQQRMGMHAKCSHCRKMLVRW